MSTWPSDPLFRSFIAKRSGPELSTPSETLDGEATVSIAESLMRAIYRRWPSVGRGAGPLLRYQ